MRRWAIAAVIALAAVLRFAGIGHHLRRGGPEFDERNNFVDPVLRMWSTGTADPVVYNGYPGLFNYLAFLPVGLGHRLGGDFGAYLAARSLVAAFGTLSVALAYLLGRRLYGAGPALFAAALLTVSRLEVRSAHYVTADVLVGTATLGALLALASRAPRAELRAGVIAGLASAVKYTGLILAPALVAHLTVERRWKAGLLPAVVGSAVAFALAAPYAILGLGGSGAGFVTGLEGYFGSRGPTAGSGSGLSELIGTLGLGVGPIGIVLALASVLRTDRRRLAPAWAVVIAMTALAAAANVVYGRHLTAAAVTMPVLAGAGLAWLHERLAATRRGRAIVAAVVVAALAPPAVVSARLVARFLRPAAFERAAAWIEAQVTGPALVASSLRLQLAPERFEVRTVESLAEVPVEALEQYDVVVASSRDECPALSRLQPAAVFASEEERAGGGVFVFRPDVPGWRPAPRPALSASAPGQDAAYDGRSETNWSAPAGSGWIEARWTSPVRVARVEVEVADEQWPQPLRLAGLIDGEWRRLEAEPLRPTRAARQRAGAPHGQVYALVPARDLTALRLERDEGRPWNLAELRVLTR